MPQGTTLQEGIEYLVAEVIDLGKEGENSIEIMVKAMQTRDASVARMELGVDARYKARGAERDCMIEDRHLRISATISSGGTLLLVG